VQQQISGATAAVGRRRRTTRASSLVLRLCVASSRRPARHQLAGRLVQLHGALALRHDLRGAPEFF